MADPGAMPVAAPDAAAQAVLAQLHPLLVPPPVAWTPQTVGWGVLAAAGGVGLAWLGWRAARRWHAARFRRRALAELQRLRLQLADPVQRVAAAREVPEVVRRLALAHAPRERVAALQGAEWLAWLDRSLGDVEAPFSRGPGRLLVDWPYRPASALSLDDADAVLSCVERWIRRHQVLGPKA